MIHLLVVEDDLIDREVIRRTLKHAELQTHIMEASTFEEASALLAQRSFDCVLSDMSLPDGDGLELINLAPSSAFVVLTGGTDAKAKLALDLGAQEYLVKDRLETYWLVRAIEHAIERKRRQLFFQESEHHHRLASLGQLAASIAHEINNPLAFVSANVNHLSQIIFLTADNAFYSSQQLSELRQIFKDSIQGLERISHIVRQMQSFAAKDDNQEQTSLVDLNVVADWAVTLTRTRIKHSASLDWTSTPGLPRFVGREGRLAQVMTNLLLNAAQAVEGHSPAIIRTYIQPQPDGLCLIVEDSGPGMSPEIKRRALEPFFTTKPVGQGTGLGLAICYEIIREHAGALSLQDSELGGLKIEVFIPHDTGMRLPSSSIETTEATRQDGAPLKILLIDDEPAILRAYQRLLRPNTTYAFEPKDALAWLETQPKEHPPVDLVLCDLMMPGLTGKDVYAHITSLYPSLAKAFVFCSGGVFHTDLQDFLNTNTHIPVLQKPMTRATIMGAISSLTLPNTTAPCPSP